MAELDDPKIEIMITHTRYIGAHCVEEWYHMPALCDCTFDTRVESIAGEEGQNIGLTSELWVMTVVIHEGLKPRHPADRLSRARSI